MNFSCRQQSAEAMRETQTGRCEVEARLNLVTEQYEQDKDTWTKKVIFTIRNVVAARLCFSQASVILFTGGGGRVSQHALGRHPPPPAATAADGMHPTGMHSCFKNICKKIPFLGVGKVCDGPRYI